MIPVRIICAYDALKTAQTLARVLSAEGRSVDVNQGRGSLAVLEMARSNPEAVVLIWSVNAQTTDYMTDWQNAIDPARLIELSRTRNYPPPDKKRAPAIDFSNWNGERGSAAWRGLTERLRAVDRPFMPARPIHKYAVPALGAISAVLVVGALVTRIDEALNPDVAAPQSAARVNLADAGLESFGQGGPMSYIEPASAEDVDLHLRSTRRVELLTPPTYAAPLGVRTGPDVTAREPRLVDRLEALADPVLDRVDELRR